MKILLIDNASKYLDKIQKLVGLDNDFEIVNFKNLTSYLISKNYDLIILSGGKPAKLGLNEKTKQELNELEQQLIRETKSPVIGICYGFRMIAEAYGSKLEYQEAVIKGIKLIRLIGNFWRLDISKQIPCYEEHHYTCKRLSSELIPLATSSRGIEIFKHKKKKIFGFQFHPEVDTELQYGDEIFKYILKGI